MKLAEAFKTAALIEVEAQIDRLRHSLDFDNALALPERQSRNIAICGREAQFTLFRQLDRPHPGAVLVTAQVARHALGGITTLCFERGLVIVRDAPARDATEDELSQTRD